MAKTIRVRFPCEHGRPYSHYIDTKARPYTKCDGGSTVELIEGSFLLTDSDGTQHEYQMWIRAGEIEPNESVEVKVNLL